jgi:hypothetical protein
VSKQNESISGFGYNTQKARLDFGQSAEISKEGVEL